MTTNSIENKLTLLDYVVDNNIKAFSTTRHGGVSCQNYMSFNINKYCGDNEKNRTTNLNTLANTLGISTERIILPHQTHQTNVAIVDEKFVQQTLEEKEQYLEEIDAVITNVPNLCVGISTADCIPVLLYDKQNKIVAAIHAGWRGTVKRIVEITIDKMTECFATNPHDLMAIIGPGIHVEAFEVGNEVYEEFRNQGFNMNEIAKKEKKWHIDLPVANFLQLENKGVPINNIQVCNICTYTNSNDFFSARKLGINSGRIYTGIMIKSS